MESRLWVEPVERCDFIYFFFSISIKQIATIMVSGKGMCTRKVIPLSKLKFLKLKVCPCVYVCVRVCVSAAL